jgi:DnaJ-class molecular chaperone
VGVYQPSLICRQCAGTGEAKSASDSRFYPRCDICGGSGWARVTTVYK